MFFKGRDADALTAAFKEFSAKKLTQEQKPSIRKLIVSLKEKAAALNAQREKVKKQGQGGIAMKPELKKLLILNAPYLLFVYLFDKIGQAVRLSPGADLSGKLLSLADGFSAAFANPLPSLAPMDLLIGIVGAVAYPADCLCKRQEREEIPEGYRIRLCPLECIILSVNDTYMDAQEVMHMTDYSKITALYSRLSVGDEDRDGGESNSIQNQKIFLENYARGQHLTNIRHYIDDDESGRFFDRSAYSRMMDDVENGKIGVCIMKDLTRWGRDYLQVGNAMEIFRRNNVRFIAVNNGIDSEKPDTLEFAPFINIMSEWYAKDISKKVKTGIKTKGMSGKPIVTEAPYGYIKDPDNKDFWIIDEEAAEVVRFDFPSVYWTGKTATKSPYI